MNAPMQLQVIDEGICGPGLLANMVLAKYLKHQPLYPVPQELAHTTLADWVAATASALKPPYRLVRDDLMAGPYQQINETPVQAWIRRPMVEQRPDGCGCMPEPELA